MLVGRVEEGKSGLHERESGLGKLALNFFFFNSDNLCLALKAHISANSTSSDKGKITRGELETYAKRLLAAHPNGLANGVNGLKLGPIANTYEDDEGADMSCRDAVEVVTRHSKKGESCSFLLNICRLNMAHSVI